MNSSIRASHGLLDALAALPQVFAIGIGGSSATGYANADSDVDVYVFQHHPIDLPERKRIIHHITGSSDQHEIPNPYWGDADYCIINDVPHDIMYLDEGFFDGIRNVVERHHPAEGYTTAFVHTLATMQRVYDPEQRLAAWQAKLVAYPAGLAAAIINRNWPVMATVATSYRNQIANAVRNNDPVSVNHRVTAFLTSAFDITFAALRMWHPGEKRLLQVLESHSDSLPDGFHDHVVAMLAHTAPDRIGALMPHVDAVAADIRALIDADGSMTERT